VRFFVPGTPKPQGSKKAFYNPRLKRAMVVEGSDKLKPWRDSVTSVAMQHRADKIDNGEPVRVVMIFALKRPKQHFTSIGALSKKGRENPRPCKKPDIDKLERGILDALTDITFGDDCDVCEVAKMKAWTRATPGLYCAVESCDAPRTAFGELLDVCGARWCDGEIVEDLA